MNLTEFDIFLMVGDSRIKYYEICVITFESASYPLRVSYSIENWFSPARKLTTPNFRKFSNG